MKQNKFEGWDYTELAKAWNIKINDGEVVDRILAKIRKSWEARSNEELRSTQVYKDCRAYLKAHIAYNLRSKWTGKDQANFLKGIQKARDPYVFLDYFMRNLETMWI